MDLIKPPRLKVGDTIGITAPCAPLEQEGSKTFIQNLKKRGFGVKLSANLYSETDGYAGSIQERADDFNSMIHDPEVKMVFFEGGEVCNEILPYLDYEALRKDPKIFSSYSDSTTLLDAIYHKSGLVTFYGSSPYVFHDLLEYNLSCFDNTLMQGSHAYQKNSAWRAIRGGVCTGKLIGGYLMNFAFMQNTDYFKRDPDEKYLLFIEDHEHFSIPAAVSRYYSHLEQSGLFENVTGLIMGNYSDGDQSAVEKILERIAAKYQIPVVKNDDFGHGVNHSILPIGIEAKLDADNLSLTFLESGVN